MKLLALMCVALSLTACGTPRMNNDMMIAEAMKCENVGLPWRQVFNYDGSVREVICTPNQRVDKVFGKPY